MVSEVMEKCERSSPLNRGKTGLRKVRDSNLTKSSH